MAGVDGLDRTVLLVGLVQMVGLNLLRLILFAVSMKSVPNVGMAPTDGLVGPILAVSALGLARTSWIAAPRTRRRCHPPRRRVLRKGQTEPNSQPLAG